MDIKLPFEVIDTPDPNERAFVTHLDQEVLANRGIDGDQGWPIRYQTLYKNWWQKESARASEGLYGNYVFTDSKMEGGVLNFYWALFKDDDSKKIPFNTVVTDFGNHHWPAILRALQLLEDPYFPITTNSISGDNQGLTVAPRYYQREEYIPDVAEGSRFQLSEFFSATPHQIPRHQIPIPTRVSFHTASIAGAFPECLHDDINIPATRTGTSQNAGGTTDAVSGVADGQFFPKTNFKSWRPYVFKDGQVFRNGGWYRARIRVFPPILPRAIRHNA